jgi:hypothetical protein
MTTTYPWMMATPVLVVLAFSAQSAPLKASAPIALPFFGQFDDVNPCTGDMHTITVTGTARLHDHDGRLVVHVERTISTSTGFEGHGAQTVVNNGEVFRIALNDVLVDPAGNRIRAHANVLIEPDTGMTLVARGAVTCVGP